MLSSTSRALTYLSGLSYLLVGGVLFLAPNWASGQFPWNVSPFVVMTIGGWCLGNAAFAGQSARVWDWKTVYPSLIYLWLFGPFDAAVMLAFRERVNLESPVALGYTAAVAINVVTALVGILDAARLRPSLGGRDASLSGSVRGALLLFVIVLGVVVARGLFAKAGGLSTEGGIFPEPLTLFSVRAFAAFFAALCLSAVLLIWSGNLSSLFSYGLAVLALVVPVLIAAFANLDKFDFSSRPGGILYLGAWVLALVVTAWGVWRYRAPLRQAAGIPG